MSPSPEKEEALERCTCPFHQVEDHWPVLMVLRHRHSDEPGEPITWDLIDEEEAPEFRDPAWPDFAVETYHPESAPNVLTPDEARLLVTSKVPMSEAEMREWHTLQERLRNHLERAEGEETK